MSEPIEVIICGKKYVIEKQILSKSEFFNSMFTDCENTNQIIINNRSPKLFKHILAFLISDAYPYPKKYEDELKYYLIDYDINKLYDPLNRVIKRCKYDSATPKLITTTAQTFSGDMTFLGANAASTITTGSNGIALGFPNAVSTITTGSNGIALGVPSTSQTYTGSNSIPIGVATYNSSDTTNNVIIGNYGAVGDANVIRIGANTTHAATITGTTLNLQPASTTYPGVISTGASSISFGAKHFSDNTLYVGSNETAVCLYPQDNKDSQCRNIAQINSDYCCHHNK